MRIGSDVLTADRNNFTVVRLVLSSLVIYTHCYWLIFGIPGKDDLSGFLGAPISVYAVDGFFFLSGFLVYPSLLRLENSGRFLLARLARLWPGLALSIVLTAMGGWFLTTAPGLSYWGGETATFVAGNLSLLKSYFTLTGITCGAEPCTVNGSLWTLPWEARCYAILAILGLVGLARPPLMKAIILPATLVFALAWHIPGLEALVTRTLGEGIAYQIDMMDRLWTCFALGVAAYAYRDRLPLSWLALAALFAATIAASALGFGDHVRALFIGYAVLCAGLLTAKRGAFSASWPDYSYGMYIFAFPAMMLLNAVWPMTSHLWLSGATFLATLPLAVFSWHLVEKPALDRFRRWQKRSPSELATGQHPPKS